MKKNLKLPASLAIFVILPVLFTGCAVESVRQEKRLTVTATFYPLAEFAQQIGGENIGVVTLVPAGSEPHDYEPSPQDISLIRSAKIFLFNGAGLDPWAEKILPDLSANVTLIINMGEKIGLPEEAAEMREGAVPDPHFWLDPAMAKKEVEIIRDALIRADPDHKTEYETRGNNYLARLSALDQKFQHGLAACKTREFVTSHEAFSWLAKRYNLTQTAIAGLSPDIEPSPRRLGELAKEAEQKNIRYIFFETLVSPRLAETLAQEIGAQTLVLNPLEGLTDFEIQSGKDYVSVMEENLNNLRIALNCT